MDADSTKHEKGEVGDFFQVDDNVITKMETTGTKADFVKRKMS